VPVGNCKTRKLDAGRTCECDSRCVVHGDRVELGDRGGPPSGLDCDLRWVGKADIRSSISRATIRWNVNKSYPAPGAVLLDAWCVQTSGLSAQDSRQIGGGGIRIDPRTRNSRFCVAALGHAYGPTPERGRFSVRKMGERAGKTSVSRRKHGADRSGIRDPAIQNNLRTFGRPDRPAWSITLLSNDRGAAFI